MFNKIKSRIKKKLSLEQGFEVPDSESSVVDTGLQKPLSVHEQVLQILKDQTNRHAMEYGEETFEEANDFECPEENEKLDTHYLLDDEMEAGYSFVEEKPIPQKDDSIVDETPVTLPDGDSSGDSDTN